MKVYISGKISDLPYDHVVNKFNWHSGLLQIMGHEVVNPINVSPYHPDKSWADYMVDDLKELFTCDAIYMLYDWGQSKGARIEYQVAKELGLKILFQGCFNK